MDKHTDAFEVLPANHHVFALSLAKLEAEVYPHVVI
jgi:hypothetical protein